MSSTTEQIKERLSIVEVVSSYVKLERAGQNWKARCPFHNERTPSFIVSPSRNSYHCFGCNRGGDIFSFVEEIEGVEFKEALRSLAERAGVALPRRDPRERGKEARAYALLEEATRFFESGLLKSPEAKEYLKRRGLAEETIASWRLGYVPDEWRLLLTHLKNKEYAEGEIEAAGLAIKSEKGHYDRFRGRIIFPIENAQGKIVGFSGRYFSKEGKAAEGAKYLNSPETALFNKSRILYGLSRAKQSMMRADFAVLVEGQMDLLMAHQAGVTNAVATSGTALTEEHLKMVRRFTSNLVLAFDSDEAGFAASERGFKMAALSIPLGMNVKAAKLPKGEDPADFAARDPAGFAKAVEEARSIVDFHLETFRERGLDERAMIAKVRESVLPLIALIPSHMDRAHYVAAAAKAVGLDEAHVWEELKKMQGTQFEIRREEDANARPSTTRGEKLAERAAGALEWLEASGKGVKMERWRERYTALAKETAPLSREKRESLILEAEVYYAGSEHLERDIDELFLLFEQTMLEQELEASMKALRLAEKGKKEKEAEGALARCHEVSKRLNEVKQELKQL
ncbi:MAG: DNA primase [bacterium]|nr:DNA primase [bacterium]